MKRTPECTTFFLTGDIPELEMLLEWCAETFDPDAFLLDRVRVDVSNPWSSAWPMIERSRFTTDQDVNAVAFKLRWSDIIQ